MLLVGWTFRKCKNLLKYGGTTGGQTTPNVIIFEGANNQVIFYPIVYREMTIKNQLYKWCFVDNHLNLLIFLGKRTCQTPVYTPKWDLILPHKLHG